MAPAPEAKRAGFSWRDPGAKEVLLAGGLAVAAGLVFMWWRKNHPGVAASTATDGTTGTTAPASPTGLNTAQFLAWIHDHQSSSTTTTPPKPKPREDHDRDDRRPPPREDHDRDDRKAAG